MSRHHSGKKNKTITIVINEKEHWQIFHFSLPILMINSAVVSFKKLNFKYFHRYVRFLSKCLMLFLINWHHIESCMFKPDFCQSMFVMANILMKRKRNIIPTRTNSSVCCCQTWNLRACSILCVASMWPLQPLCLCTIHPES